MENKKRSTTKTFLSVDTADGIESSSTSESSEEFDSDFENSIPLKFKKPALISKPLPKSLPNFAAACDGTGASCRAAAKIVTAALDDIEGENANIIDKNKVIREKQKSRKQYMDSNENANVISLYFDGRKDRSLFIEESGTKRIRREVIEKHVTVLAEPGSKYLGHFAPSSGSAKNIANSLIEFCKKKQIDINKIQSIGCDGTNTNVGWKTGVIRRLEENFQRPLHWIICQLYGNELPLRHLLIRLDGKTGGPTQFTGPIGKLLNETRFENLQVVNFQPIPAEAIDVSEE